MPEAVLGVGISGKEVVESSQSRTQEGVLPSDTELVLSELLLKL